MRLQQIQLRGFKTFADRTQIEFGEGITAIVGPNGAGKSNLTDAILWVLGEQSQRAIRSQKWEDVIFAGSDQRAPLGMAEVLLTLDNSDGALPLGYSEVVVGRRLFRSGESEYLLNGSVVRLREIQDLLVDTGLGPEGYAVVTQGEIDAILSARPEDRRELIEQVAGVRRYQLRRAEAERRLERTQGNLNRVKDILYELGRQRQPLEQEAEVARQYQALAEELQRYELSLLVVDWDRRQERRGQAVHEKELLRESVERSRTQLQEVELERERLQQQSDEVAQALEQTRGRLAEAQRRLDRSRQALEALSQQRDSLQARRERLAPACEELGRRREELAAQVEELVAQTGQLEGEVAGREPQLQAARQGLAEAQRAQETWQRQREALARREAELQPGLALARRELEALDGLQVELESRIERLQGQQVSLEQRRGELQTQVEALRDRVRQAQDRGAGAREQCGRARQAEAQARRVLREHRQKKELLAAHVGALESRARVLAELVQQHEGFAEGPRAIVQAGREGQLAGVLGLVGDMLEVPRRVELAVVAGLGERLQWVLVEDATAAWAAARYAQEHGLGRVTLLPADRAPVGGVFGDVSAVGRGPGVVGTLRSQVRVPKRLAHLFDPLLEGVLIVSDLDQAQPLRSMLRGPARLVTMQGEMQGPLGEVSVGNAEAGVQAGFERKRELRALGERVEALQGHLASLWEAEERLEAQSVAATEAVAAAEAQAAELEKQAETAEAEVRGLADSLRAAHAAVGETTQEVEALREQRQQSAERAAEAERTAQRLGQELRGLQAEGQALAGQQVEPEQITARHQQVSETEVAQAQAQEKLRSLASLREQAQGELDRVRQDEAQRQGELREIEASLTDTPQRLGSHEEERAAAAGQVETLAAEAGELSVRLADLRHAAAGLEASRKQVEALAGQQREELYRAELNLARSEAALENLETQLRELYSLTVEEARPLRPAEFNEHQARREANHLRAEIRALGSVNLSAIEEVQRLAAREQYLSTQAQDLEQAREDLLEVIAEVDQAATVAFEQAFGEVGAAFQELFEHFFPGGETSLVLTEPEHPLISGVEVLVRLPGKRRQNLLLLSGGERAMTAVALLFAMIQVRPAPFCVMDEIDAAIDATNTEKLVDIVRQFAEHSQFIVITHNPRTMESAGVLYGVTMRQAGVSRVISVTLAQAQQEAREQDAAGRPSSGGATSRVLPVTS